MATLRETDLKRLHREWRRRTEGRLSMVLDDVATPFNVGAIVRTAAAERVEHLYLSGATVVPTDSRARKLSMGTDKYLTWSQHESGVAAVAAARDAGYRVVAVELAEDAVPFHQAVLGSDVCLAVGHEDHGLSKPVLAACDEVAFIPQLGRVGSLNVAHAAAIAIYEVRRRSWTS